MSIKYPVKKEEFLNISGVGETKYSKYGKEFQEAIIEYAKANNLSVQIRITLIKDMKKLV